MLVYNYLMNLHIPQVPSVQKVKGAMSEQVILQIPQCCREGWDDCIHVAKKTKVKRRSNIGL